MNVPIYEFYKIRPMFKTDCQSDLTTLNQTEQILTSSTPMTPAPITIISPGTFFRDRAPVEDTMDSSSI